MNKTKIEWTDYTWNPVTGCNRDCYYCYAKKMAIRLKGRHGYDKDKPFKPTFHPDKIESPLKQSKPSMIFTCSMGDFFDDGVKEEWREQVYKIMDKTPSHVYQILTKQNVIEPKHRDSFPKNLWVGVTIDGTTDYWKEILHSLKKSSAAIKFISFEPIVGSNFPKDLASIDWVIVGAQTGVGAKEVDMDNVETLVKRIEKAGIPLFVKPNLRNQVQSKSKTHWKYREDYPNIFINE